jgi:GNAT superfamily N-acetyltransferase
MRIHEATIEDASSVSDLIRPLAEKYIVCDLPAEGAANLLASVASGAIEKYIRAGYRYHVAEEGGTIIGVVGVRDNSHLYHLFVADRFQGRGIARSLWLVARDACLKSGSSTSFTVNSSVFAVGMYRKRGFVETGPAETKQGVTSIPMKLICERNNECC